MTTAPKPTPSRSTVVFEWPQQVFDFLPARVEKALRSYHVRSWTNGVRVLVEVPVSRVAELEELMGEAVAAGWTPPAPPKKTRQVKVYGCCRCQKHHREGDALYQEHIYSQSKHGIQTVTVED